MSEYYENLEKKNVGCCEDTLRRCREAGDRPLDRIAQATGDNSEAKAGIDILRKYPSVADKVKIPMDQMILSLTQGATVDQARIVCTLAIAFANKMPRLTPSMVGLIKSDPPFSKSALFRLAHSRSRLKSG